jgi:uncharacterized RDD family membrane protein YckC
MLQSAPEPPSRYRRSRAAFILSFLLFLTTDIFFDPLTKIFMVPTLAIYSMWIIAFILCMLIYLIGSGGEYSPQVITFITGLKDSSSAYQFYIHILLAFTLILTFFCIYNIELYKIKRKSINEDKTGFINGINKNISKALQILGVLSFGLYVWHEPIFANSRIMTHQNDSILCYLFICIKALFLTFILSLITYYIIERPFEKYRM